MYQNAKRTRLLVTEPMLVFTVLAFLAVLISFDKANAASAGGGLGKIGNALPAGVTFPTPVGILYPGLNVAAGVNAAALPGGKKVTSLQLAGAPALSDTDSTSYFGSLAFSNTNLGWSVGYTGSSGTTLTNGMFAGVGFNLGRINLGIGLRDTDLSGGFSPNVDIGLKIDMGKDFTFGAVAYTMDTTSASQYAIGLGYGHRRKDNVELNVLTPAGGGSDYAMTFAATVYTGRFGTNFRTSYFMGSQSFSHTLGALYWLGEKLNVMLQLNTPKTLTVGLTWVF